MSDEALKTAPNLLSTTVTPPSPFGSALLGCVVEADSEHLGVTCSPGNLVRCELLESVGLAPFEPGDRVLVLPPALPGGLGVVVGRVLPYQQGLAARRGMLQAGEALSIRCGESSIDLRADGKVMIRGEDVLVRAKGTQRIRAGTVAIN